MSKIAFIFPGQGAQYVGMAKDFYDANNECKKVFQQAAEVLDFDVLRLCFEENELIHETEYTQALMVTACVGILKAVEQMGIKPDVTAGLSLGEYAALVSCGALRVEDAIGLVRKRGIYMANEVPSGEGAMAAVLGLEADVVEEVCKEVSKETNLVVEPANYNCPGQIVISGHKDAIHKASQLLTERKARRVLPLTVSGPFHSSMLLGAGEKLAKALEEVKIHELEVPYASNVTGTLIHNKDQVKELLTKQVATSVRWQQCVEAMIADGVDTFIEIGPGKTLSGFLKKIDRTKTVLSIEKYEDLEKLSELAVSNRG